MHRALLIPEILALILKEFPPTIANKSRDAVAMARTCRLFLEPALNVIWHALDDLFDLLRCLPEDLWELQTEARGRNAQWNVLVFRRLAVDSDWDRFEYHSRRVRSINLTCLKGDILFKSHKRWRSRVDKPALNALVNRQTQSHLFPALQTFSLRGEYAAKFQYLELFLVPSLRNICLSLPAGPDDIEWTNENTFPFSAVPERCPLIQNLKLPGLIWFAGEEYGSDDREVNPSEAWVSRVASNVVLGLSQLRLITCGTALPADTFASVTSLESLHSLDIHVWPDLDTPFPASSRLHTICLRARNAQELLPAVRSIQSNVVMDFQLSFGVAADDEGLAQLCRAIASNHAVKSVMTLLISASENTMPEDREAEGCISFSSIEPLFALKNLESLCITPCITDIDDSQLARLAQSWPNLRRISLYPEWRMESEQVFPAYVTPLGLIPLVQHCPHLRHLGLLIDASDTEPRFRSRPARGAVNRSLWALNVGVSTLPEPAALASFLSDFLPGVVEITQACEHSDEDGDDYEQRFARGRLVEALIQKFANAREQERAFAVERGAIY